MLQCSASCDLNLATKAAARPDVVSGCMRRWLWQTLRCATMDVRAMKPDRSMCGGWQKSLLHTGASGCCVCCAKPLHPYCVVDLLPALRVETMPGHMVQQWLAFVRSSEFESLI